MYTIKGLKTFIGNEGRGYNVSLYRDGIRVAFVIDDASGGMVDFQWVDRDPKTWVDHEITDWNGEKSTIRVTPEEKKLYEFIKGKLGKPLFDDDTQRQMEPDEFVAGLINAHEIDRKLRNLCKKNTLIRITGDPEDSYRTVKLPFTPKLRASLVSLALAQGKEVIEFINETLAKKETS